MMSLNEFTEKLQKKGFTITNKKAAASMWLSLKDTGNGHIPAIVLDGPPGVGKTFFAEKTAEVFDAEIIFFQFYRGAGKEDLLYDLDLSKIVRGMAGEELPNNFQDMVSLGVLPRAAQLSQNKKVVLILDEMDKSHPSTDAMLLDFLQSARLQIPHVGEIKVNTANILVVFTKNDERELSEPLLRRCRPVLMDFPPADVEINMIEKYSNCLRTMAKAIVTMANNVRGLEYTKAPSTPELIRLIKDIALLYEEGEKEMMGEIVINTFFPNGEDIPENFSSKNIAGIFYAMLEKDGGSDDKSNHR